MGKEEALKILPSLVQAGQVFGRGMGDFDKGNEKLFDVLRAGQITGHLTDPITRKLDPERVQHFLDVIEKSGAATGWRVNPDTWLGIAKQGGISLRGLSDEGLLDMAAFAQNMGGPRAGTAMMSLFQQFAGGTMGRSVAEKLEGLGLLGKDEWKTDHGKVVLSDEALKRLGDIFKTSPLEGLQKVLLPAMEAHGFKTQDEQIKELFRILQRATTQRFLGEGIADINQMFDERNRMTSGMGVESAALVANANDIATAIHNLASAFDNLKTSSTPRQCLASCPVRPTTSF
jgi:hypothetical protein